MNIKFSELKALRAIVGDEWRDITCIVSTDATDTYDAGPMAYNLDYRVIAASDIDQIQQDELADDLYILGCFADWFIAEYTGIDFEAVQAMQKAEAFEAVGKLILSLGKLENLQNMYASADGYGHHFSHYDSGEELITLGGQDYYVFRVN